MIVCSNKKYYPHLYLIEDDVDDQYLITSVLKKIKTEIVLSIFSCGVNMLNHIDKQPTQSKNLPDLILLDLNMPSIDGIEVLKKIRKHPNTSNIPVVIFTTSNSPSDLLTALKQGANSFIIKPRAYDDMHDILSTTCHYWFEISRLSREVWS
ncbi:response regulator [Aliikangiella sp. IMCC44359]|uniref:response regulator n=1 Tax=Aliikangiella sp. IMCC44359 TaxID=3459125 RepID=UPI00403AE7FB